MRLLIILIYLLPSLSWGYDDSSPKHFAATAAISSITCAISKQKSPVIGAIVGLSAAMMVGHMKETTDADYDKGDMQWNAIGAVSGVALCFSF